MATSPLFSSPTVVEHAPTVPKTFHRHDASETESQQTLTGTRVVLVEEGPSPRDWVPLHTLIFTGGSSVNAQASAPLRQVLFNGKDADARHRVLHSTDDSITIVSVSGEFTLGLDLRAEDRMLGQFGFEPFELERLSAEDAIFLGDPHRRILKRRDGRAFTAESAGAALLACGIELV